jgi:hypothetical protein
MSSPFDLERLLPRRWCIGVEMVLLDDTLGRPVLCCCAGGMSVVQWRILFFVRCPLLGHLKLTFFEII